MHFLKLDPEDVENLLSKLCTELGFCLPPESNMRLRDNPPLEVKLFTDEVFRLEGLNPETVDRHLYRQVRDQIQEAFRRAEISSAV